MFVAFDKDENRIYANNPVRYTECFCPACNEKLIHKIGKYKRSHFAHQANTNCYYGNNKDNKCEWHIRMQEYFPQECREYRFVDEETGEVHIADVFIPEENVVIEFQHSPITLEEYHSRTVFHLKNKRGIIWVFDESKENQKENEFGRFKHDSFCAKKWPYDNLNFKWLRNPRKFLADSLDIEKYYNCYAVYVYTGSEGESTIRRIVSQDWDFEYVTLSFMKFDLNGIKNIKELFIGDNYWIQNGPLRDEYIRRQNLELQRKKAIAEIQKRSVTNYVGRRVNRRRWRF